jgi:hypothetical protein
MVCLRVHLYDLTRLQAQACHANCLSVLLILSESSLECTRCSTLMQDRTEPEYTLERESTQTRDQYNEDAPIELPILTLPVCRWTSACKDDLLLNQLLTLFWTWDNTVEPSLYRPLFEEDLVNHDPRTGTTNTQAFCSSFLVNALLALSCVGFHRLLFLVMSSSCS